MLSKVPFSDFQTFSVEPFPRVLEMAYNHYQTSYQASFTPSHSSHHGREQESYDNREQRYGSSQSQMQNQLQRSKEASKQMLYGTFGNALAILEEFEERENAMLRGRPLPKSRIHIPDQKYKSNDDIESIVNTQILLFETQTRACPPEVLQELKDELKRRTIAWAAVREEMGIKGVHKTDMYVAKMYEILAKGRTQHTIPDRRGVTEEVMRDSYQKMLHGDHDRRMVDESFKRDPSRRAAAPDTRTSEMYHEGAQRITRARGNNDLDADLHQSVRKHQTSYR